MLIVYLFKYPRIWTFFINKNQNKKVYSSCIMSTDIFLSFVTTLHFMRHAISSEQTGGDVFLTSWIVVRLDIYLGQIRSFKGSQHHINMILTSKQIEFLKYMFFFESVQNTFCWTKSNRCIVLDYFWTGKFRVVTYSHKTCISRSVE